MTRLPHSPNTFIHKIHAPFVKAPPCLIELSFIDERSLSMFEGSTQTYFYVVVCPTLVCRVLIAIMYKHTLWKLDCVLCKSSIKCQLAHTLMTDSPVDNRYF